jgi:hypothetical protein
MSDEKSGYSDREVAIILKKAVDERSRKRPDEFSLEDLETIARDSGIPIERIRTAAAEVADGRMTASRFFAGAPMASETDEIAAIAPTDEELAGIAAGIDATAGTAGTGALVGREIHWTSGVLDRTRVAVNLIRTEVEISPSGDATRVTVRRNFAAAAAITHAKGIGLGIVAGGGLVAAGILGGFAIPAVFGGAGILVASWLAARAVFRSIVRNGRRKAAELAAKLRRAIESHRR